jgi:hypothetical protein
MAIRQSLRGADHPRRCDYKFQGTAQQARFVARTERPNVQIFRRMAPRKKPATRLTGS